MATARAKVEALFTTLSSHIMTVNGAPGTTAEYPATLSKIYRLSTSRKTEIRSLRTH